MKDSLDSQLLLEFIGVPDAVENYTSLEQSSACPMEFKDTALHSYQEGTIKR